VSTAGECWPGCCGGASCSGVAAAPAAAQPCPLPCPLSPSIPKADVDAGYAGGARPSAAWLGCGGLYNWSGRRGDLGDGTWSPNTPDIDDEASPTGRTRASLPQQIKSSIVKVKASCLCEGTACLRRSGVRSHVCVKLVAFLPRLLRTCCVCVGLRYSCGVGTPCRGRLLLYNFRWARKRPQPTNNYSTKGPECIIETVSIVVFSPSEKYTNNATG
jgi:hypothetical protein